jgi:hypothetical protein
VRFLEMAETKQKFLAIGLEAAGGSPEQLSATMKAEMARVGKLAGSESFRRN